MRQACLTKGRNMSRLNVVVLYGGKSTEHEVSVHSAQTVCRMLQNKPEKYQIYPIFIDKQGLWFLQKECGFKTPQDVAVTPVLRADANVAALDGSLAFKADVFFPVLHGTNCEDGTMQGLLETLGAAYVGCGVLASAMGMDKEIAKLLAAQAGVEVLPYVTVSRGEAYDKAALEDWVKEIELPVFVKPVRLGSSVGVRKVKNLNELHDAVSFALQFDTDVMIEKGVDHAREIFCALYGEGEQVKSSLCGELRTVAGEFFDYNAKYVVAGGCETKVPAEISQDAQICMRADAETIFRALRASGLARVDFLMDKDGRYYFSEINTLPGMSETSLFPQLFEASGEDYGQILDGLIALAQDVLARKNALALNR